jgi:hypothetical protein
MDSFVGKHIRIFCMPFTNMKCILHFIIMIFIDILWGKVFKGLV